MSSEGVLTDEDEALLDHLDGEIDDAEGESELEAVAQDLREKVRDQRKEIRSLEREFSKFQESVNQRLSRLEERDAAGQKDEVVPLETWLQLDEADRDEELSTSEQIAVTIHENWHDIAWKMGGGSNYAGTRNDQKIGVDTNTTANAKYNPSKLKHRLKQALGFEPHHEQVHRGLKRLADATGGSEEVDVSSGRVLVVGGWYEYRELPTPDGNDTKRVLWRNTDD